MENYFHYENRKESIVKIFFIGDIHGKVQAVKKAINTARVETNIDLIVLSGDIGEPTARISHDGETLDNESYHGSVREAFSALQSSDVPILFVTGNHDLPKKYFDETFASRSIINLDLISLSEAGQYTLGEPFLPYPCKEMMFFGFGGSNYKGSHKLGWPYEWSDEEIKDNIDCLATWLSSTNNLPIIFVSHDSPFNTDLILPAHPPIESLAVKYAIEVIQPRLFLCGHIHESTSAFVIGETLCLNAGELVQRANLTTALPCGNMSFPVKYPALHYFVLDLESNAIKIRHYYTSLNGSSKNSGGYYEQLYRGGQIEDISHKVVQK